MPAPAQPRTHELAGQRVLIMGLGRFGGGVGVARFLHQQNARLTITDLLPASALAQSQQALADLPDINYRLGEHRHHDFTNAQLIVANPAVPAADNPYLQAARQAGVPITSEIQLLAAHLPNRQRVIGVTGTAGKSTVTAMIGHILAHALGNDRVHVGGNIGGSLLPALDRIAPDHWVVLELSSFMLHSLDADAFSPAIALISNLNPNHLDWHGSFDAYRRAKQIILDHQHPDDAAILGPGMDAHFTARCGNITRIEQPDHPAPPRLPGSHNALNAALAIAAAQHAGIEPGRARQLLESFTGLPHRLQTIAEHDGIRFVNDSKSTTPDAARLAIESFPPQAVHLIAGGYDKGSDLAPLTRAAAQHCAAIYTIGATGPAIAEAAHQYNAHSNVHPCSDIPQAVRAAARAARPGQIVLLSPGCASWDQFDNYEQRGRCFAEAVQALL